MSALASTGDITIVDSELEESFILASGPGGQNVNKVSTKVELRFDVRSASYLPSDARARLLRLAASRIDQDGVLRIASQSTRSQAQNLDDALARLAELVRAALVRPKPRRKTKPTRASKERRLGDKRKRAETKRGRRRADGD